MKRDIVILHLNFSVKLMYVSPKVVGIAKIIIYLIIDFHYVMSS